MKIITLADGTKLSAIQVNMVLDGLKDMSYLDEPKEWPRVGDSYWYMESEGYLQLSYWRNDRIDNSRKKQGNIYQTEKEGEIAVIRDRGMKVNNTAKKGEKFWVWDFGDNAPRPIQAGWHDAYTLDRKFKTKEEAQAWGDEYSSAFIYFN